MAPRGRNKQKNASESGTSSVADSEDVDAESTSSRRPRRSRQPKRYFDDDYSPPPAKRRANRETPVSDAPCEEEEQEMKMEAKTPSTSTRNTTAGTPATGGRAKPKGRPKKNPTPLRAGASKSRKSRQPEEDIIYMDEEDTEEEDEDSDDEFVVHDDQMEEEDELEDDVLSSSEVKEEEDSIFCPWAGQEPETLPKLELPESSADIPIPRQHIMDAIEVYEILRSYHRTLRITPFTFEDFCAALISRNNSCIMAEVHMALLRVCLKSDDEEQTHYSVTETNNAVNIMLHHMDTLTYAEILRQYIESYPYSDTSVRDAINVENYPYVGYEAKLVVLLFMSYRFLYSSEFKKVVNNAGKFQNDENCRVCGKSSGRVIGCSQCEAAFHVECSQVKPFPEVLVCFICKKNDVKGVLPLDECVEREPLRSQPIGRDRYGRLYWFLARRILVQSLDETELHYYSTPPQLYQLLNSLDRDYYERDLCEVIRQRIDELLEQMTLTLELTTEKREGAVEILMKKNQWNYEYAEPTVQPVYLHKDSMKRMASILRDVANKSIKKEVVEDEPEVKPEGSSEDVKEEEKEAPKYEEDSILPETMLGIFNGELINTYWSGGTTQEELTTHHNYYQLQNLEQERLWRMGDVVNDESFMSYYNYYFKNDMAESFLTRKKQTDKKKYMASKFATIEAFEWIVAKDRLFYGNSMLHTKFVAWTLAKTARKIPADLMHRRWPEIVKLFDTEVTNADDYKKLGKCLLQLDAAARRTIFMPQWWNGLGQTRMERITQEQREQFTKEQQRVKKMELEALSKDLDDQWIRVNYSKPKWPNTYILRQKGETYRNAGKGHMGGWAWVAKKYQERWVDVPQTPQYPLPVEGSEEEKKMKVAANQKARRLNSLLDRIAKKRDLKSAKLDQKPNGNTVKPLEIPKFKCYSPACLRIRQNIHCYSSDCRRHQRIVRKFLEERMKTNAEDVEQQKAENDGVLGEDRMWPIPEIQTFSSRGGGKSLFVLQKSSRILRRLVVTAGCQPVYMPGFSSNQKSNLLIWPYPSPRPTLDLCWKWQTLNARNLHAIALQLRIMWSSIKWNEFEPEDNHPDRRVVIDTPNHDERRRIVRHKEMPPYGQYERYELEIEIIPLYEEQEDEDESWLSRSSNRQTDCSQKGASRVGRKAKRPRTLDNRTATAIRHEWVDGISLKVFEIKDYWKNVRMEHERWVRRKLEAAKKAARAREDAERQRQITLQRITVPRTPSSASGSSAQMPTEKMNVPYVGRGANSNRQNAGYLEKYNTTSQLPPCPPDVPLLTPGYIPHPHGPSSSTSTPTPSTSSSQSVHRVMPNPVRKVPVSVPRPSLQDYRQLQYQQQQQQRAAAGADYSGNYATTSSGSSSGNYGGNRVVATGLLKPGPPPPGRTYYSPQARSFQTANHQNHHRQQQQQQYTMPQYPPIQRSTYSNGQPVQSPTVYQNGGPRVVQEPYQQLPQQRRQVVVTPQNHVRQQQVAQVVEEAYRPDQPPTISRYDQQGAPQAQQQGTPRIYTGQQQQQQYQVARTFGTSQKKFVYVRSGQDGSAPQQQRVLVRGSEDYPPGTVLQGPPNGPQTRLVPVRTGGGGGATQVVRQITNPDGTVRYVRPVMHSGAGGGQQVVRRVVPVQAQQQYQQQQQQRQPFQDLMEHDQQHQAPPVIPQHPRFVIQRPQQTASAPKPRPQPQQTAPEYPMEAEPVQHQEQPQEQQME